MPSSHLLFWLAGKALPSSNYAWTREANVTDDDDDDCSPPKGASRSDICDYVMNTDSCAGGGYLGWTSFVMCADTDVDKWLLFAAAILFLFCMFLILSSSADDFFSPNISAIVSHLKISENVAGVTFMAFGNGAPDVFSSIASVMSTDKPKAGLALGELLGGAIFVSLCVTATIVFARPFKAMFWSTLRDLVFFIFAVGWLTFVFAYADQVYVWQPAVFLGVYAIYVVLVIGSVFLASKRRKIRAASRVSSCRSKLTVPDIQLNNDDAVSAKDFPVSNGNGVANGKRHSVMSAISADDNRSRSKSMARRLSHIMGLDEDLNSVESENEDEEVIVVHNKVYKVEEVRTLLPTRINSVPSYFYDLWTNLRPMEWSEFVEKGIFGKFMAVISAPFVFILKMTIPLAEAPWNKTIAIIQALLGPCFFLVCIKDLTLSPFAGSPGLWVYGLAVSAVLIALLLIFTEFNKEPRFYKETCSYLGFLMSVAWIYAVSAEVVDAVDMIGVVSGIDASVLGLTIIAWSNSIADLIADFAVARQGFPRMAISASIGGPLFNILIGFGVPFTIAKAQGKTVSIKFTSVNKFMVLFLGISVLYSTAVMIAFKAQLRRWYAIGLVVIYVTFLVLVILAETKLISW